MTATFTSTTAGVDLKTLGEAFRNCGLDWSSFHSAPPKELGIASPEAENLRELSLANSQLLVFALSPVQEFIEASKSLRDLWASSLLLSKLVGHVMDQVRGQGGFIVYPQPYSAEQQRNSASDIKDAAGRRRTGEIASTPHRFLAVVPRSPYSRKETRVQGWPEFCDYAFEQHWKAFIENVRTYVLEKCPGVDWKNYVESQIIQTWGEQTQSFWETRCVTLPLSSREVPDDLAGRMLGGLFFSDRFRELHLLRQAARGLEGHLATPDQSRPLEESSPRNSYAEELGRWQLLTQLAQRLLGAVYPVRQRNRFFNVDVPKSLDQKTPDKCQMFGSYEVLGPGAYDDQMKFWNKLQEVESLHLKPGERFSAIGLIKRLLPHCQGWKLPVFDDSARVAAARWLETEIPTAKENSPGIPSEVESQEVHPPAVRSSLCQDFQSEKEIDWRWLHSPKPPKDEQVDLQAFDSFRTRFREILDAGVADPPVYYAALLMDADYCHRRLSGQSLPSLGRELEWELREHGYHTTIDQLRNEDPWFERNWDFVQGCRRPLTPAYHVDLSRRQSQFGAEVVPDTIIQHCGQVVYNGGDEFLALLPVSDAFPAAGRMRSSFSKPEYFGPDASMSAGMVLAHHKADLRLVLQETRRCLHLAKQLGRNLSAVSVLTSSGQSRTALCPWPYMAELAAYIAAFSKQADERQSSKAASDRWMYQMLDQWDLLKTFTNHSTDQLHPAILQSLRKRVSHAEPSTCTRLQDSLLQLPQHQWGLDEFPTASERAAELVCRSAEHYVRLVTPRIRQQSWLPNIRAFEHYLNLLWIASFCTRGGVA